MFSIFKSNPEIPKVTPRSFDIPKEHIAEVLRLKDEYHKAPSGQDNLARYNLWHYISKQFPDLDLVNTHWRLVVKNSLRPNITEVLEA